MKVEKKWPRSVRSLYARLRTGHAMELGAYRHRIDEDANPMCEICGEEEETIDHVLCRCPADEQFRRQNSRDELEIAHMTSDPDLCRRILVRRRRIKIQNSIKKFKKPKKKFTRKHDDDPAVGSF